MMEMFDEKRGIRGASITGIRMSLVTCDKRQRCLWKGIFTIVIIYVLSIVPRATSQEIAMEEHSGDFCQWQSFNASCPSNSVILMTRAHYGRMRLGTCMHRDYTIGCYGDVIKQVDDRCSGRRQCAIALPDPELHEVSPCPDDLGSYLEASYRCIEVHTESQKSCRSSQPISVESTSGYLSSLFTLETDYGSDRCPWKLHVLPGQHINITLLDFGVDKNFKQKDNTYCPVYAKIKEPGEIRVSPICGDVYREKRVFTSVGNEVEVTIEVASTRDSNQHFVFKYEAVGCPTPSPPVNGWVQRDGNKVVIGCNRTTKKWHLVCQGTHWVGKFDNCTKPGMLGQVFTNDGEFPFGLVVSIVIGVVLGVVIGVSLLAVVLACRRRRQRQAQEAALVFERPYGASAQDSTYEGNTFQKWGPGAHGAQYSSYAHIWELKQNPGQMTQYRETPRLGDNRVPMSPMRDAGAQAALARCQHKAAKEHIYESPKFERKESSESYTDPPFYHEFDLDNPNMENQGQGNVTLANQSMPNKVLR